MTLVPALFALLIGAVTGVAGGTPIFDPVAPKIAQPVTITLPVTLADGERLAAVAPVALPANVKLLSTTVETDPLRVVVRLASFAVGELSTGPVDLTVVGADGVERHDALDPVVFTVVSVVGDDDTPAFDGRQATVDYDGSRLILPAALALAVLAALAGVVVWLKRRWKRREGQADAIARLSPADMALSRLDALEKENPFGAGDARRHFYLVSEILRNYVEGRHRLPAMERTTLELTRDLKPRRDLVPLTERLVPILRRCDRVKFSTDGTATADEATGVVAAARALVNADRPEEATP
jgi:hypothetical protein